jgi:hypothetical protein
MLLRGISPEIEGRVDIDWKRKGECEMALFKTMAANDGYCCGIAPGTSVRKRIGSSRYQKIVGEQSRGFRLSGGGRRQRE